MLQDGLDELAEGLPLHLKQFEAFLREFLLQRCLLQLLLHRQEFVHPDCFGLQLFHAFELAESFVHFHYLLLCFFNFFVANRIEVNLVLQFAQLDVGF